MALDPSVLLDQIETAITALHTGQHSSYSIGARTVTRLDLATLYEERRLLKAEVDDAAGGSITLAKFQGPSR